MSRHLIIGAGPVGRHTASLLVERGEEVLVASRSGSSTGVDGVEHLSLDASDAEAVTRAARGAAVLYSTANPGPYPTWERQWPPMAQALLAATMQTGAIYAAVGNLYPYGPVDVPMTEELPDAATDNKGILRARIWADMRAAHDAGRVRALEVRGSDWIGGGIGHVSRVIPRALHGRRAVMLGRVDQPHTFTDVRDVARTLIAAAEDPSAHGRTWHVPSHPPRTQRQIVNDVLAAEGRPAVPVHGVPVQVIRALGRVRRSCVSWPRSTTS